MNVIDTYTRDKAFEAGVQAHLFWHVRLLVVMNRLGSIAEAGALNTGSSVTFIDAFMLNWKSRATGENEHAMESAQMSLWVEESLIASWDHQITIH